MLYSIYNDSKKYAYLGFDWKQIVSEFGESPETRFDANRTPRPYAHIWKKPIRVFFSDDSEGMTGSDVPEIAEHQGRLFLSEKAYKALYEILKNDGEFLSVEYEQGKGYIFNPLQLAESVDGLNKKLSVKNEWDEVENISFDEGKVKGFAVFKSEFDNYFSLYCQESVKDAIENAGLKGVIFTPDLGNYLGVYETETN